MWKTYLESLPLRPNWFHLVNRETLRADLFAGMTNAVLVIPQAVAFALIAGLPPECGFYTAIVTPIVAAIFGSSWHLVSGPTTPVSLTIFAALSQTTEPFTPDFIEKALLLTFLVGIVQLGFGLARLGILVNFVSQTVVIGFTAGAAVLIFVSQLKNVLGLPIPASATATQAIEQAIFQIWNVNEHVLAVAVLTFILAVFLRKLAPRSPYLLVALIFGSAFGWFLGGEAVGVKTIGPVPSAIPPFHLLHFQMGSLQKMLPNAVAIAILGLIQALAIAKTIAEESGQRLDINRQFVGEGLSNLVGPFFSSYVGTGSFTRSGVNFQAGARTPMSAIFAALGLLLILLVVRPWVAFLAIPAMGAVIFLVAWNLLDFKKMRQIHRASRLETTVFAVTFVATLLLSLEFAILLGAVASLAYFLFKISRPNIATMAPDPERGFRFTYILRKPGLKECPQAKIVRIDGPLFYGSIEHITEFFDQIFEEPPKNCLVFAEGVNFIGLAGAEWILRESRRWEEKGGGLYFVNLKLIAQDVLTDGGYRARIGEDHFFDSKTQAIEWLHRHADRSVCEVCRGHFSEISNIQH